MEIKIISFDIDGTLVDPDYNDLIWHRAVPEMVAKKREIDFENAVDYVQQQYDRVGKNDYRWYDIKYWIEFFQLKIDYQSLLEKYENQITLFPNVPEVLAELSKKYQLISISTMPREFMDIKIKNINHYFKKTFSTLSDFQEIKNKDTYLHISNYLETDPQSILHIGDHEEQDFIASRKAGWNALLIDRFNMGLEKKYPGSVIFSLPELLNNNKFL